MSYLILFNLSISSSINEFENSKKLHIIDRNLQTFKITVTAHDKSLLR